MTHALLLLRPLLGQAYGGIYITKGSIWGLALLLLVPVVVPLLLVLWAFLRPARRWLLVGQALALLGYYYLLYTGGFELLDDLHLYALAPYLSALVLPAALLNGLAQARVARRPGAYLSWVGLAVVGAAGLFLLLTNPVLAMAPAMRTGLWLIILQSATTFGLNLVAWWVVLRLLQARHDVRGVLWQPWWRAPAVAAGVLAGWSALETLFILLASWWDSTSYEQWQVSWREVLGYMGLAVGLRWAAGVAVLRLLPARLKTLA